MVAECGSPQAQERGLAACLIERARPMIGIGEVEQGAAQLKPDMSTIL